MKKILLFLSLVVLFFIAFLLYGIFFGDKDEETVEDDATEVVDPEETTEDDTDTNQDEETEDPVDDIGEDAEEDLSSEEGTTEDADENADEEGDTTSDSNAEEHGNTTNTTIEGVYVGLVDSNSIEVNVGGTHETFTFTEGLQDKIFSLTENTNVSITLLPNDNGNKVIQDIKEK